ncbi:MAG TPA: phosphotransferase [Chloroflexota bacterium]|nr:phosphotransferase [Chloroflexota bacterium]
MASDVADGEGRDEERKVEDGRRPIEVVHSTPSGRGLLTAVLSAYDLPAPLECRYWTRDLNDIYLVRTGESRYILRLTGVGRRALADLRFEADFLLHLHGRGVAVGTPIAARDGELIRKAVLPEGLRYATLFTYAPGAPMDLETEDEARRFGRAVAGLHLAGADFVSRHQRFRIDLPWLLEAPFASIDPLLAYRPSDLAYVHHLAARLKQTLEPVVAGLEPLVCHGDLQGKNAHLGEAGTITFFDFDGCGQSWLAYDLAWCRGAVKDERTWAALLAGYTERRPVAAPDLEAVPLFRPAIRLWNMGMQLSYAQEWGFRWYGSDDYFDWNLQRLRQWEQANWG